MNATKSRVANLAPSSIETSRVRQYPRVTSSRRSSFHGVSARIRFAAGVAYRRGVEEHDALSPETLETIAVEPVALIRIPASTAGMGGSE